MDGEEALLSRKLWNWVPKVNTEQLLVLVSCVSQKERKNGQLGLIGQTHCESKSEDVRKGLKRPTFKINFLNPPSTTICAHFEERDAALAYRDH